MARYPRIRMYPDFPLIIITETLETCPLCENTGFDCTCGDEERPDIIVPDLSDIPFHDITPPPAVTPPTGHAPAAD